MISAQFIQHKNPLTYLNNPIQNICLQINSIHLKTITIPNSHENRGDELISTSDWIYIFTLFNYNQKLQKLHLKFI